jgi:UDP-N-acetylglucosamine/UDP-N-acetylgalactosamine diphosphorylase
MQVDNPLVEVCDPEFLGYHLLSDSEMSTLAIAKRFPMDRVGNIVSIDGQVRIIEYSDLPDDMAERRATDASLLLWAGNTAIHAIDTEFLRRMSGASSSLPYHRAVKAVPYVDDSGSRVEPSQPNAIKFERFIFDLLPHARRAIVVEVDAEREFAPVKNAPGAEQDSPELVQERMISLHREWLRSAGAAVDDDVPVEISPLFALDDEEVAAKVQPGTRIDKPTYFHA